MIGFGLFLSQMLLFRADSNFLHKSLCFSPEFAELTLLSVSTSLTTVEFTLFTFVVIGWEMLPLCASLEC